MIRPSLLLTLLTAGGFAFAGSARAQVTSLVRVAAQDPSGLARALAADGFDVVSEVGNVTLTVSAAELFELEARGLSPRVLESGRPLRSIPGLVDASRGTVPSGYQDLAAIEARLAQVALDHPSLCRIVDLSAEFGAPLTSGGRSILAAVVSANVALDEDEPAVLIASAHHCREVVTPVIALEALDRLTDGYGVVPSVTEALDTHEIWIIPVVNPDGYEHVFNVDNLWRKNRRPVPGGIGIDLNRNYPQGWENGCSGSTSPGSSTYKGPSAASESETQALLALSEARRMAKVLDFHSSGREVLWGYACPNHPYDAFHEAEALAIAQAGGYGNSARKPSADGEHQQWHHGRRGAWAVLIETALQFQPSYASALAEATQLLGAIDWLLARPIAVSGHVTDACTGAPVAATITEVGVALPPGEENRSGGAFGRWHANLPPGPHTLRFEAPGYAPFETTVVVPAGGATTLDVVLGGGAPEQYCAGVPNSTSAVGRVDFVGSTSVAANDVTLVASDLPPSQFCLFVQGQTEVQLPLFDGFLCVSDPIVRLGVVVVDGQGFASRSLDLTSPPQAALQITPGTTWNFQVYYRDSGFGFYGANLTTGLRVTFCP